ncbi:MAG: DUF1302 domain-containing protein, partial [Salinisphaera sp.]|nr:DUF1302 domain-containing protein [Salinisphaera sp.]
MYYRPTFSHLLLAGAMLLGWTGISHALTFEYGEFDISLETSLTAGIAIRAEDANNNLIGKANNAPGLGAATNSTQGSYSVNGDDGNIEFADAGDVFFSQLKLSSEINISRGDWGLFARGNYRFDPSLNNNDFYPGEDFGAGRSRSAAIENEKNDAIQDAIADDAELFDLYVYGAWKFLDRQMAIRVGRQVINWGKAVFFLNGINSIVPIDARQARGPGAEVKEVFRPIGALWFSTELFADVSLEAFYQYDWEETIVDPAATYFSTADFVGAGGSDAMIGFGRCNENTPSALAGGACAFAPGGTDVPHAGDDEPEDGGQYGLRLSFLLKWLNYTGLSLYAMNYHSRLPLVSGTTASTFVPVDSDGDGVPDTALPITGSGRYFLEYPEDIELYGLSFDSYIQFINVTVQGEFSVKQDQPLQIDDVELLLFALGVDAAEPPGLQFTTFSEFTGTAFAPNKDFKGYIRRDVYQWDISFTKIIGPNFTGANQTILLTEISGMHVSGLPSVSELPLDGPATYVPNQAAAAAFVSNSPAQDRDGYPTASSWGYVLVAALRYQNVLNRFNLTPSLRFFHDVNGNSPGPIRNHLEDTKQLTLGLEGTYGDAWEAGLSYTAFWGGQDSNAANDVPVGVRGGGYSNNLLADR